MVDVPEDVAKEAPTSAPRFACFKSDEREDYFIFVEKQALRSVKSFTKALMLWFALYYVFNLRYCKQAKELACFFQEFVFELPLTGKSATYLAITTDVRNHIQT